MAKTYSVPRQNNQKTIYVAGPMRGYESYNFPAFDVASERLRDEGWFVISPAELDREHNDGSFDENTPSAITGTWEATEADGFDIRDAVMRDAHAICTCHAIYMLKGWEKSRGSAMERATAIFLGLDVLYEVASPAVYNSPQVPVVTVTEGILEEAARLTTRDRHDVYGHPLDDFSRTAAIWEAIIGAPVTQEQYALCMMAVKMSRLVETPTHRDSLVDIAGYANCYAMVTDEKARRAQ